MKIALIHYWFYGMRGGEKVVAEILRLFPEADLFTHLFLPDNLDPQIADHYVTTTFIAHLPFVKNLYQAYLPLMPAALKRLDLSDYDLIISSESGPAKGIVKRPDACHICYCHSPMRYIWDQQPIYLQHTGYLKRLYLKSITPYLRSWDIWSAGQVDHFIANSDFISRRIKRIYGRESTVIYPPVAIDKFRPAAERDDYFIMAGQLVPYKRPDLAVAAFNQLGLPLKIVGTGSELVNLRKNAGQSIEFIGFVDDDELRHLMAGAQALIFPGKEDFGIIPVEAQAAGVPVIALGAGGVLETVNGFHYQNSTLDSSTNTGIFFDNPEVAELIGAVEKFLKLGDQFSTATCRRQSKQFSVKRFIKNFKLFVDQKLVESGFGID